MNSKLATIILLGAIAFAVATPTTIASAESSWSFEASDVKGKKKIFGPYATKVKCMQARSYQAKLVKWVLITSCHQ